MCANIFSDIFFGKLETEYTVKNETFSFFKQKMLENFVPNTTTIGLV